MTKEKTAKMVKTGKITKSTKTGKKQRSIRTLLSAGFIVPILMIVALGGISYSTASSTIMSKYEDSSRNTILAMGMYADTLANSLSSRSLEQVNNSDMQSYYSTYASNKDPLWLELYTNSKGKLIQMYNTSPYMSNYYTIPKKGSEINSLAKDLGKDAYQKFMDSDIGLQFQENVSKKNGWFGYHTAIDEMRESDGGDYAFTYVQKFIKSDTFLVVDWSMQSVEDILSKINFGVNSISALISEDGREIARVRRLNADGTERLEKVEGNVFVNQGFYQASLSEQGIYSDYVTLNGESYLFICDKLDNSGMCLCSLIPQDNIIAEVSSIRNLTIIVVVFATILSAALCFYIAGGITKTVRILTGGLEKVSGGDLTQSFRVNRRDELGTLAKVLNDTIANIKALMADMKRFGGNVSHMSLDISEKTDALHEALQNISNGVGGISQGLQVQAKETDNSNSKMTKFAEQLDNIHNETTMMSGAIEGATEAVNQGRVIISDLSSKAQTTNSITNVLVENVNGVQNYSNEIEGIIDTINSIAEQTNLLSLNASIEAARAGESGRGFAVVADEIRKLADQSSAAAGEVQQILNHMSVMTDKTTQSAAETQNIVALQSASLDETIAVFGTIDERVKELVNGLNVIAEGMNQINRDKDDIQTSFLNISVEAEAAAESAEKVTTSLDEQAGVMGQLAENMEYLQKETSVLDESINKFKID